MGIDVVVDGEFYCWDVNYVEMNGMIDYFIWLFDGICFNFMFVELEVFWELFEMCFWKCLVGLIIDYLGYGIFDLVSDYEFFCVFFERFKKFIVISFYMLVKIFID